VALGAVLVVKVVVAAKAIITTIATKIFTLPLA